MKISAVIEGLQILQKTDDSEYTIDAAHDQIWAGGERHVSEEERKRLLELGWFFDTDIERWSAFT